MKTRSVLMGYWSRAHQLVMGYMSRLHWLVNPDVVYAYGAASFASSARGNKLPAPTTSVAKALTAVVPKGAVKPIDEYGTTKMGSCCQEKLDIVQVSSILKILARPRFLTVVFFNYCSAPNSQGARAGLPVSYTHLTLPTIYSV